MDKQLNFLYDQEADVLYVSLGKPEFTDYVELGNNLILRLDPETKDVVGFTVIDFVRQAKHQDLPLRLPLQATFERTRHARKTRVVAEKKTAYRIKGTHRSNTTRQKAKPRTV